MAAFLAFNEVYGPVLSASRADYLTSWADMRKRATCWNLPKAAKDWPQINFVIYHSAMRPFLELPDCELEQFEMTGRFDWVSELADIPAKTT